MKKLKLDDLLVDSFPTSGPTEERGTVVGLATDQSTCEPKWSCTACESYPACTLIDCSGDTTCEWSMYSCDYTFCGECTNSDAPTCVGYC